MASPALPQDLRVPARDAHGLLVAFGVMGSWAASLGLLLSWSPRLDQWPLVLLAVAVQTWLYTGLFITAHDAMHGTIAPGSPRLNDAIGRVIAALYAAFSFDRLREAHRQHHATPARPGDPDWHDDTSEHPVRWYLVFLRHYLRWWQVAIMAGAYHAMHLALGVEYRSLQLFWILPSVLSTVQLFYFGTWRPHREPEGGHDNEHHARSSGWPGWLSLLSCFHFGYHHAHHAWPGVPWWRLPRAERVMRDHGRVAA